MVQDTAKVVLYEKKMMLLYVVSKVDAFAVDSRASERVTEKVRSKNALSVGDYVHVRLCIAPVT